MPAARSSNPPQPTESAPPSFESAMERLEAVVEQMESSKLPLEDLIRCYEEGTQLIKICSERLTAAEQRIEIITRDAAGQTAVVDYPPSASALPASPPLKASKEPKSVPGQSEPSAGRSAKDPHEVSLF